MSGAGEQADTEAKELQEQLVDICKKEAARRKEAERALQEAERALQEAEQKVQEVVIINRG